MADEKPLTKQDFLELLKNLPTKQDVEKIIDDAITSRGLATKGDLSQVEVKLEATIEKLERSMKRRMGKHRREIMTMLGQLATSTPTRSEFNELNEKLESHLAAM